MAQQIEELLHLPAPLAGEEAEVRDDHAQALAAHVEIDIQRVSWLAPPVAEGETAHFEHFAAGEQSVAERAVVAHERQARHRLHAEAAGDVVEAVVDFLQPDGVALELADHRGDARGVLPAVGADAAVDVVGGDPQAALGELVRERLPVS